MAQSLSPTGRILILGLDTFAKKNIAQIRSLEAEGYSFTVMTNDQRNDSRRIFDAQGFARSRLIVAGARVRDRLASAWRLLRDGEFDHVELYAAGRMAVFYLLMLKLLRQTYVVVERGDIGCLSDYGLIIRIAIRFAYRWADGIIYKETYMEEPLRAATRAPLFFVPNSVDVREVDDYCHVAADRKTDFLWVNRIVPQRRPAWVLSATMRLPDQTFVMLGFEDRGNLPSLLKREQQKTRELAKGNTTLLGFIDPEPYYKQSRFFCLPAEVVFGNNSLLEAMSWGVVPVVTQAPGVGLLVENGVNGIVTDFEESAFQDGLARAAALGETEWQRLSEAAIATVREKYSVAAWTRKMVEVYRQIVVA